jgi:hypothetical protein
MNGDDPFLSPGEADAPVEFEASYYGQCTHCGDDIEPGDLIRSDGYGEWECAEHAD